MKELFYLLFGILLLLGAYFVLSSLFGHFSLRNADPAKAKLALITASIAAAYFFYKAYLVGEIHQRWGAGIGLLVLGFVTFQIILLLAALVIGKKG